MTAAYSYRALAAAFGLPEGEAPAAPNNSKSATSTGNLPSLSGAPSAVFATAASGYVIAVNASVGLLSEHWVDELTANERNGLAKAIANDPRMRPLADSPRPQWLAILFGFAALGVPGATEVCEAARTWSKTSSRYSSDADFGRDWNSFDHNRTNGISVGTLIYHAENVGVDLQVWREIARNRSRATAPIVNPVQFFTPVPFDQLHLRPPPWLVSGLLMRGETTTLAGQGGGAKTAWAVHVAVTLAAGFAAVGPFEVDNRPGGLRVAYISAEEDVKRLGLLVAAACQVLSLTKSERALVDANVRYHDAQASGWRLGASRPGQQEEMAPEEHDQHLWQLKAALPGTDLLILDTLAALFALPNENDNNAITALMQRLNRATRQANCAVLLLHHTPKMTREVAAAQRGEATLVRGGGAITNSARVVLTITSPPAKEHPAFIAQGVMPDRGRRLEHAKINDAPPMAPAFFELVSQSVKVHDGSDIAVRAVRFPASGSSMQTVSRKHGHLIMTAADAGVLDQQGARVPLTFGPGPRNATRATVGALRAANPNITDKWAEEIARRTLKGLKDLGCISEEEVRLPQYKNGVPNGTQAGRGLVTHWDSVPWRLEDDAQDQQSTDAQQSSAPDGATDNTVVPPQEPGTGVSDGHATVENPNSLSPCHDPVSAFAQADRGEG